jgi:pSer/pThr/pTyr-binding forkhead associated (FHA) protein
VGREAELKEYLQNKMFVSRHHAKLTMVAGEVFIENLSGTNKTFLNNVEIPDGTPTALSDGDEIGLGGKVVNGSRQADAAYFVYRVKL